MDWSGCDEVECVPGKVSGQPILKGTRVPADSVSENYGEGYAPAEVAWMFRLNASKVQAVIEYAEHMGTVAEDRVRKAIARSQVINWSGCPEVEWVPGKLDGMALLKGTSVPAEAIFDDAEYSGVEVFARKYGVDPYQVQTVIDYIRTRR